MTDLDAKVLRILKTAADDITAAEIAYKLLLIGSRETKRRKIRAIVKRLREEGNWIVATLKGGYWLTADAELWFGFATYRRREAGQEVLCDGDRTIFLRRGCKAVAGMDGQEGEKD